MGYKEKSLLQILTSFEGMDILSPTEISEILGKSKVIVHKYIKELVKRGDLIKIGKGTHTKYKLSNSTQKDIMHKKESLKLDFNKTSIILNNFYKFDSDGQILSGIKGFEYWCYKRGLNINEKTTFFINIFNSIESKKNNCGLIDSTKHFKNIVTDCYMNKVFYVDQYKRMEFGK